MKAENGILKNSVLEKLTKSNPKQTLAYYTCLVTLLLFLNYGYTELNLWLTAALLLGGVITWTLLEYFIHRYIFRVHKYFPLLKRVHHVLHGIHLNNPRNLQCLFMSPVPCTFFMIVLFSLLFSLIHLHAFAFMGGIILGYLFYAYVHFMVHTRPGKLFFHGLWLHHLKHHYKYPDKAFGVSTPLWDIVFGTMPPKNNNTKRQLS